MDDVLLLLRKNLRALRLAAGETQALLAWILHVDRKTISSYENGRTTPDLVTLIRIADHYHVTVDDLLRRELKVKQPEVRESGIKESEIEETK